MSRQAARVGRRGVLGMLKRCPADGYPLMIDSSDEREREGERKRGVERERERDSKRVGSDACQIREVLGMLQRCPDGYP